MNQLKNLLVEAGLYGLTIKELLDKALAFQGKTLIFFDTETTGLNPHDTGVQLTELAAIAFDGSTWKEVGQFHGKAKLNRATQQSVKNSKPSTDPRQRSAADILRMTRYGEKNAPFKEERKLLEDFASFMGKYPNPIMVAHNATFDMRIINVRGRQTGAEIVAFKKPTTIDTRKIAQLFFVPLLKTVKDTGILDKIRTPKGGTTVSMGKLAPALNVTVDNWHSAIADVKSMIGMFEKILDYLKSHKDTDIRTQHGRAVKDDIWLKKNQQRHS